MTRAMPRIESLFNHQLQKPVFGYIITCGRCGVRDVLPTAHFRTPPAWQLFLKHFQRLGWIVGPKPAKDVCPTCLDNANAQRRTNKHRERADALFSNRPHCQAPSIAPAGNVIPLPMPAAHQFGPTYTQLKELQARFADGPATAAEMRARIAELKTIVADSYREIRQLEIKLLGSPTMHLPRVAASRGR